MKKKLLIIIAVALSLGLMNFWSSGALANGSLLPKPDAINSQGRIVFDQDGDQQNDVVFDAQDMYYLYKISQ